MQGKNKETINKGNLLGKEIEIGEPSNLMIETTITTARGKKPNNVGESPTNQTARDKKLTSP